MSFLKQELKLESIVRAARIKRAVAATDVRTAIDLVVPDQRAEEMVEDQALGLRGRIDKIDERRSGPIPVDYKTGAYYDDPPEGQKVQLYAYALLLERQRGCSVPFGIIEYTSIDRQVPVLIGEDEKRYVLTLLDDVKRIVERKEEPKEEEIKKEKSIICSDCGMMVKNPLTSAQAIVPSGRTYFFDDVGCMIRWVDQQSSKDKIKMYVYVPECSCYIDPFAAWYVRDGITPIGYGVVAYGTSMSALLSDYTMSAYEFGYEKFKEKEKDKQIYEFDEVRQYVLRGETLLHPIMKKLILQ